MSPSPSDSRPGSLVRAWWFIWAGWNRLVCATRGHNGDEICARCGLPLLPFDEAPTRWTSFWNPFGQRHTLVGEDYADVRDALTAALSVAEPDYKGSFLSAAAAHRGAEVRCAELGAEVERLREDLSCAERMRDSAAQVWAAAEDELARLREAAQAVVRVFEIGPACASALQVAAWVALRAVLESDGHEERPVESRDGVPTEHGDRCDAGVHAAVSWTYIRGERADEALLRIRRALKEPRGWWTGNDEEDFRAIQPDGDPADRPAATNMPARQPEPATTADGDVGLRVVDLSGADRPAATEDER